MSRRIELWFWAILPAILTLVLMLAGLSLRHLSGVGYFTPLFALICIFYWGLSYGRSMPYWFLFFLGLFTDVLMGMPLGLSSLLYMVFLALLQMQHKYIYKESFFVYWGYFAAMSAGFCIMRWVGLSFFNGRAEGVLYPLLQWMMTACFYPLLHKIFVLLYKPMQIRRWQLSHA